MHGDGDGSRVASDAFQLLNNALDATNAWLGDLKA